MNQRDELDELLGAYFDGELVNDEQSRARSMLAESDDNQRVVEDLELLRSSIQDIPQRRLRPDFQQSVVAEIDRRRQRRRSRIPTRLALVVVAVAAALLMMWLVVGKLRQDPDLAKQPGPEVKGDNLVNLEPVQPRQENKVPPQHQNDGNVDPPNRLAKKDQSDGPDLVKTQQDKKARQDTSDGKNPLVAANSLPRYTVMIELMVTEEGLRIGTFENALQQHNITYQPSLKVDPVLEKQLLDSKMLRQVTSQVRDANREDEVQLVYVIVDQRRVDPLWRQLRTTPNQISEMKFNVIMTDGELKVFEQLRRREAVNFAKARQDLERARKVVLSLALMSKLSRRLATAGALQAPADPADPPAQGKAKKLAPTRHLAPAPAEGANHDLLGNQRQAQILFVIHRAIAKPAATNKKR